MTECNSQIDLFSIGRRLVTASFVSTPLSSDIGACSSEGSIASTA